MAEIEMPAVLADWGCDASLWSKIRSKKALVRLAEAGDEQAGRERITTLKRSPSIVGSDLPMPPQLRALGVDEVFWDKVISKAALAELCESGDEEALSLKVASLRSSMAAQEATSAETRLRRKAKKESKPSKWAKKHQLRAEGKLPPSTAKSIRPRSNNNQGRAKPLSDGYTLAGPLPSGVDVATVEALLAKRIAAKKDRDFETADNLQGEILKLGVGLNDRRRTYFDSSTGWSYKS